MLVEMAVCCKLLPIASALQTSQQSVRLAQIPSGRAREGSHAHESVGEQREEDRIGRLGCLSHFRGVESHFERVQGAESNWKAGQSA